MPTINRRKFLRAATLAGAAAMSTQAGAMGYQARHEGKYMGGFAADKLPTVRAAFIGVGLRGPSHLRNFGALPNTEIVAISDLHEDQVSKAAQQIKNFANANQHPEPKRYYGGEDEWRKLFAETKPDVVFISTNWVNHAPMAIAAMEAGAHAFVEVPLATTIEELWAIVDASERTQRHCMMMENVNYGREELMYLNMVRQGLIGEPLHAEAAYIHDLREQLRDTTRGEGVWRTGHFTRRNGNLYPTHGLGPVAQYMNLARGEDNFRRLVSFSSPARGRALFAKAHLAADNQWNQTEFAAGDINTTLIKTALGRTIMVQWDETSPRPYSRHNLIQGTKGTLAGFPTRVALEGGVPGITEGHHSWAQGDQLEALFEKYDHPLYKKVGADNAASGHGGMDGVMMYRIVECLREGLPLDQNVYEGAFWSAVSPLSEASVTADGMPQDFPDFTRGNWKDTAGLAIM